MADPLRSIDFDPVALWYDLHVRADFDHAFWIEEARRASGRILELMCGTGRLSVPMLRSGAKLTCADYSAGLLGQLRRKLTAGQAADLVQADARALPFTNAFDSVFIGFHAFAELSTERDQREGLESIRQALRPGGRLVLSLHNPAIRAPQLDGAWRDFGAVPIPGTPHHLQVLAQFAYDSGAQLASGLQRYRVVEGERTVEEFDLPVRFRLITAPQFEDLAAQAGLRVETWWGDYQRGPLDPETSPYLIASARRL